jgi:hypothetical protein
MKKLFLFLLLIALTDICFAQTEAEFFKKKQLNNNQLNKKELVLQFTAKDFSRLWTKTANENVYGFIGDKYQRIRVKFLSVNKIPSTNNYVVSGKTMVKTNICDFQGTISITNIRKLKTLSLGVDDEYKNKGMKGQYVIIGDYSFSETKGQSHSGTFKGSFETRFYENKNNIIIYDDIDFNSDGYINNEFVGKWGMYNTNFTQACNWGDYRIPNSGDLDIGAGEFSPNNKYLQSGWQTVRNARSGKQNSKAVLKAERDKWWQ